MCVAALAASLALAPTAAAGNPASQALRAKAANAFYNLDHDAGMAAFKEAVARLQREA